MEQVTQWRGGRDTSRTRLWRLLALSALLHAPLTPIAALVGLIGLLRAPPAGPELPDLGSINAIPVDLLEEGPDPGPAPSKPAAPVGPTTPAEGPEGPKPEAHDGDKAELATPESKAQSEQAKLAADGGAPAGGSIGDPVAMAGAAGRIADANANVRVLIFCDRIRNHPLGDRIGALLGMAAQWQDFFGPAGLDPIHDVDRILIAGPQLRDSAEVVAVIRTNVSAQQTRSAVDALVARGGGEWLDAGVPAAHAKADRAERVFVMPTPNIVVVAPPSAEKHALTLGSSLRFPNPQGSEALTTYVLTPWRAFVGIPFQVPQTIKWVRMKLTATSDGGASADIVAEDESEEAAKKDAGDLTSSINAVTQINLGVVGALFGKKEARLIEPVTFSASGKQIHGTAVAKPKQLRALLEAIAAYAKDLADEAERKRAAREAAAAAEAGAPDASAPKPSALDASAIKGSDERPAPAPDAG